MHAVHLQDVPEWIREIFDAAPPEPGIETVWAGAARDVEVPDLVAGADVLLTSTWKLCGDLLGLPGLKLIQVQSGTPRATGVGHT